MPIRSQQLGARGVSMDMETSWAAQGLASTMMNLNDMARFQQKQLQEKEQKLLQLYDQQQQRAYQVVQRGSAGSNGSNQGSTVSHQTVTRTSSTSHTTSTSQGGKVRQMFDERRQTTVKGIDKSYPLEPLDNKPRKQTTNNGVVSQRGGNNLTVNRQSVTVKRVARADVNSNVNGGKPVVSYHEEITRESFGPPVHHRENEEEEFGDDYHVASYANGNHRDVTRNEVQIEEVLDEDTIEKNRLMAKIHLMGFDESLKYRVKNDIESEQFPDDLMIDVPDKLPKRNVTKKLSQAEARLERFKNANAKKATISKSTNPSTITRKRSEPMFPSKSISRVTKSPSPDPSNGKSVENVLHTTSRRIVPSSPSRSPDIVSRQRATNETKMQESRASKRIPLGKSTESVGNKKATATNRTKGADVVDGTALENGVHSRDHQTKYENESLTTKKSDAFVIDFDDRSSKENEVAHSRNLPFKRPSTERQQTSSVTARPTSSISSISSASSTQGQISRGKMAGRARSSNAIGSKTLSAKSGGGTNNTDNLVPCKVCGRRFAQDRITLHEQICSKTGQKKRKQFDTVMYRVKGTDLESFVMKKGLPGIAKKMPEALPMKVEVKSNWRRKHEDFINAIRSAKQMQAHLAAGGKLSDLPPPPVSDTSDYIQCPHCSRKFNQAAAERHIPKCEHMLHNKPAHARPPKPKR